MLSVPVRAYDPLLRLAGGATLVAAQQAALVATESSAARTAGYGSQQQLVHTAIKSDVRGNDKLQQLQAELGYKFRSPQLLQQALSKDKHKLLAYLGDVAVRMLFEEYAFGAAIKAGHVNVLTPHLDVLVTRQHFTAVAMHKWHLHKYMALESEALSAIKPLITPLPRTSSSLQARKALRQKKAITSSSAAQPSFMGSILQPISSSVSRFFQLLWPSSNSSSSGGSAAAVSPAVSSRPAAITSKPIVIGRLAETVEAVIAAILLDSNYSRLRATLHPWVASTYETTNRFMANQAAAQAAAAAIAAAQSKLKGKLQSRAPVTAARPLPRKQLLSKQLLIECLTKQLQRESAAAAAAGGGEVTPSGGGTSTAAAAAATVVAVEQTRAGSSVTAAASAADSMFSLLQQHQQQWQSLMQQLQQQQGEMQQLLLQKQHELVQQQQQMQFRLLQQQQEQWCEMSLQQQQQVHQLMMQLAEQQQQQQQRHLSSPATEVSSLRSWDSAFRPLRKAADTDGAVPAAVDTSRFSGTWVSPAPPAVSAAAAGAAETIKAITINQQQRLQWQQQWQEQQQQWFASILQGRLHTVCGYTFHDNSIAQRCSQLLWHKMVVASTGQGTASFRKQIEVWGQMGNWLTRLASAQRSWRVHCRSGLDAAVFDLHQTTEQLNNRYHRARIVVWMGLDPTFWCPSGSSFYNLHWDQQAEKLSQCLFLILTAVYLDGGMIAALDVADVLLANTPRTVVCHALRKTGPRTTDVDLSWVPQWGKCGGDDISRTTAEMEAAASIQEDTAAAAAAAVVLAADADADAVPDGPATEAVADQKSESPRPNAAHDKATTTTSQTPAKAATTAPVNVDEAAATAAKSQGSKAAAAGEQTPPPAAAAAAAAGKPLETVTVTVPRAASTGQTQKDMSIGSGGTVALVLTDEMLLALKKSKPSAAAALLKLLADRDSSTRARPAEPVTTTSTTGATDTRLLDVEQVEITKGAAVEILVQRKGKRPPFVVATATVDSVDITGNAVLDAGAKLKVKPGLVLLKKVKVADARAKRAGNLILWQTVENRKVKEGSTTLWDAKAQLDNGMKLPVPTTVLRVVPPKETTQK